MSFAERRLGEIVTLQRGFDITKSEQTAGEVPIVSSSGIASFHGVSKVKGPGVVIGRKGSLGTVHYVEQDHWPHDTTLWVKDYQGNERRFVAYFLRTLRLENFDTGSSNPTLNRNHAHKIKVLCPEPLVQRKIAAILSAYDDLIANNQRRIALLESMAEEIYREWFVRMRFPHWASTSFVKGVPADWKRVRLGDVVELGYGKALKDEERVPGDYPVFGSAGVVGRHNTFLCPGPGIVVGRKGNVGSVHWSDAPFFPIDTTYFVKSDLGMYFVYFLLQSMNFINNDSAVPGLSRTQAYSNEFYLPGGDLVRAFNDVAQPIFTMKSLLRSQVERLASQRDALLPRLISGKLKVDHLDIQLPPSMREKVTA
jgi:type I restriction enzyme, S subunit